MGKALTFVHVPIVKIYQSAIFICVTHPPPPPPPRAGETISRLTDLCESEESSRAALHQKILRIIFSGVLQLFLAAIEDARREAEPVNLPRFSAFIKYLSAGSGNILLFVTNHSLVILHGFFYHIMHSYKELNCTIIVQLLSVLLFTIT